MVVYHVENYRNSSLHGIIFARVGIAGLIWICSFEVTPSSCQMAVLEAVSVCEENVGLQSDKTADILQLENQGHTYTYSLPHCGLFPGS
jgi:hypothetical protein